MYVCLRIREDNQKSIIRQCFWSGGGDDDDDDDDGEDDANPMIDAAIDVCERWIHCSPLLPPAFFSLVAKKKERERDKSRLNDYHLDLGLER